jgi:uncharacterized phiE125 gp8 family phage protein
MGLLVTSLVSSATGTVIDLEEIKRHLRIPIGFTHDDDYLESLRDVAINWVEEYTNRKLAYQRWKVHLDNWPSGDCITIPYAPLSSAPTTAVRYTDSDSSTVTFSSSQWELDTDSIPGRLCLKYNEDWPTATLWNVNPITVEFRCGHGNSSSDIPVEIRQAMLLVIGDLYENRENTLLGVVPHKLKAAERLIASKRVFKF